MPLFPALWSLRTPLLRPWVLCSQSPPWLIGHSCQRAYSRQPAPSPGQESGLAI